MGEYQYYEFQALDKPLSSTARAEMQALSSRVQLTANSASFVYHYSDLPADPYVVLQNHFDVMLYITNWGSRRLMFRFPIDAIPKAVRDAYQYVRSLDWSESGQYVILDIQQNEEEGFGWIDGEGFLSGIAQVRNDILRGDYRALYVAWLMIAVQEFVFLADDEDLIEPPVPSGLDKLSPTLQNFINFFELDHDLVKAASKNSLDEQPSTLKLSDFIDNLSDAEKSNFLRRLLSGESHLDIALSKRLRELSGVDTNVLPSVGEQRTLRQIMALGEKTKQQRHEDERKREEAERKRHLEKIASQEAELWEQVSYLIEEKRTKEYELAIEILKDLRDLAQQRGESDEFHAKIDDIYDTYPTLRGLHRRLKAAKLTGIN